MFQSLSEETSLAMMAMRHISFDFTCSSGGTQDNASSLDFSNIGQTEGRSGRGVKGSGSA